MFTRPFRKRKPRIQPTERPNLALETAAMDLYNVSLIAGIDEAGRGAIAGPVFAAAVILPISQPEKMARLAQVDDSKKKTARQREALYELITQNALAYGVGSSPAERIDNEGIITANARAMAEAAARLDPQPEYLLIDGRMRLKNLPIRQESVIRGDAKCLSIAAASILAKVSRDRYMIALATKFPEYGWERNKGYCTVEHVAALDDFGPTSEHRLSFAPLRSGLI